jgi:Pyruvate/2-oxoacid:ferredoxin oxidoreductase delta subunit
MAQPKNAYNETKLRAELFGDIPKVPEKFGRKVRRPQAVAFVYEGNCTGCEVCIPFCPVACIEVVPKAEAPPDRVIPPVRIRYDECIGCEICARVCTKLAWDAIGMIPTAEIERDLGITIHEKPPPAPVGNGKSS